MVKYQRRKTKDAITMVDEDEESCLDRYGFLTSGNYYYCRRDNKRNSFVLFLLFLLSCCLLFVVMAFFFSISTFCLLYSFGDDKGGVSPDLNALLCSSVPQGSICCDRTSQRSDICVLKGDVRTRSGSSSIVLYNHGSNPSDETTIVHHEKIKPYTRKWEASVMQTIDELQLVSARPGLDHGCDVQHDVPAVVFSTGGYTGNLYHEFNDGILPLYITSQHMKKRVVFVILEYHNWWITKYGNVLKELSNFPAIDFSGDNRTHCFPEAIVGLRIHNELSIDPARMEGNRSIRDFRELLDRAYWPRIRGLIEDEAREAQAQATRMIPLVSSKVDAEAEVQHSNKPKLVIMSRKGSRAIANEDALVELAKRIGFLVEVLRPDRTTELAKIYRALNSSNVMIGVHGAAMTHFLFMRRKSVFIQVVPLGTDWAAETYYGEPARKLGLKYVNYKILPKESSLYDQYDKDDPVLRDPNGVTSKGWEFTKRIYLDGQIVKLNLRRFEKRLLRAYDYTVSGRKGMRGFGRGSG